MEIKAQLIDYTDEERTEFIVQNNHRLGYEIEEYTTSEILEDEEIITITKHIEAWGLTQEEIEEKEKKHIKSLTCTKRVFALMLQELGVDYITKLKPLIESNPQAQLEWDLCVELLRANPMLDFMAGKLGISPEQLDALFLYANGEITKEEFESYKGEDNTQEDNTQEEDLNEEE